jgi:hypothetical protein
MHHVKRSDTVLLSGWLFADLLLGLMIIFFVSIPGAPPLPVKIPRLIVNPLHLDPSNPLCKGGTAQPQCSVTLEEAASSDSSVDWAPSSDISESVVFSPHSGTLSPGKSVTISISAIICQNGSFTFSGSRGTSSVTVSWHCIPPPQRLDFNYQKINVTVHNINGLLNDSPQAINDIKQQVKSYSVLQGRSVGLAIVYDGALIDTEISQAQQIAGKVYRILGMLGQEGFAFQRASYYVPLYTLGADPSNVEIDTYLFKV